MEEEAELTNKLGCLDISDKSDDELDCGKILYFGWLFETEVCTSLKQLSEEYLKECFANVPQFERFLRKQCEEDADVKDPLNYYRYPAKKKKRKIPNYHVTSKFCGREEVVCLEYKKKVLHLLDNKSPINIIGLFFTPKTFGYRVKLTKEQKLVFDERRPTITKTVTNITDNDDNAIDFAPLNAVDTTFHNDSLQTVISPHTESKMFRKQDNNKCNPKKKDRKIIISEEYPGLSFSPVNSTEKVNFFRPSTSRAHITLGCGKNIQAVQVGEDLLDVVDCEQRSSTLFYTDYKLKDLGTLRQFGRFGDAFVLYLNNKIIADATFSYKI